MEVGNRRIKTERAERLEARLTPEQKRLFVSAAELQGRSLSDFVVSSAIEKATQVLAEMAVIRLDAEQSRGFATALLAEPHPNEALLKAFEHRHRLTGE